MEYNSSRPLLEIPEYGRNVQKLINYARTIDDDGSRQRFVEKVIDLMMQLHPQNRNVDDYREKLWAHVFQIGGYDLDVNPPSGVKPDPADAFMKPEQVPYPVMNARFRHYGSHIQTLIDKAVNMEAGPIRQGFVEVIGSYMKLAYRTWNKEHYVSDDIIKEDLMALSDGVLELRDNANLDNLGTINTNQHQGSSSGGHHRKKGKSGGGRGSGGRSNHGGRGGGYRSRRRGGSNNNSNNNRRRRK